LIKLIILILTIYLAIRVGRIIGRGIGLFKVQSSKHSNISGNKPFKKNNIEEAEFEDITDEEK